LRQESLELKQRQVEMNSKALVFDSPVSPELTCPIGPKRVLLVDDELTVLEFSKKVLTHHGFICEVARNFDQAACQLARASYDVVITDLNMPGQNGLQLVQYLAQNYPTTAVMMLTGENVVSSAVQAMSSGAYDYMTKPFVCDELVRRLSKVLERRQLKLEALNYQDRLESTVQCQTEELQQAEAQVKAAYAHTLGALIQALDAREKETQKHSKRVSEYTLMLARHYGVPSEQMLDIEHGSLLHDIGKIGVPDAILLKPGKLTAEDWEEIRKHPVIGHLILSGINFLHGATELVLQHHERFDGTGYPLGLAKDRILLGARIFAIADTFDAMTSDRPYRRALTYDAARQEIIRCCRSQFDPELVDCFLEIPEQAWIETRARLCG